MNQSPNTKNDQRSNGLTSLGIIGHVKHPLEIMSLMRLLLNSFLNSEESGLTGAFFYDGTNIGEILEGSAEAVERRWQSIRSDATFKKLKILGRKQISIRHYSSWCMHAKDGSVVCSLYPELAQIIEEFNLKKSVFETISCACETTSLTAIRPAQVRFLPYTLH